MASVSNIDVATLGNRWVEEERDALTRIKKELEDELKTLGFFFPEVHGDRRLLRYLRKYDYDVEKSSTKFREMLHWRKENRVDEIREKIVNGRMWHPRQFENGENIVPIAKGIIAIDGFIDKKGQPVSVEFYNYKPQLMAEVASIDDLVTFHIWCMELKMLVLEHMSNEMEAQKLQDGKCNEDGWGEVLQIFIIRDLGGFNKAHLAAEYREMVGRIMALSAENYPNALYTCAFTNTPFSFRLLWTGVKQFLPAKTTRKMQFFSASFLEEVGRYIDPRRVPRCLGGGNAATWESGSPIKDEINLTYIEDRLNLHTPAGAAGPGPGGRGRGPRRASWIAEDAAFDLTGDLTRSITFEANPEALARSGARRSTRRHSRIARGGAGEVALETGYHQRSCSENSIALDNELNECLSGLVDREVVSDDEGAYGSPAMDTTAHRIENETSSNLRVEEVEGGKGSSSMTRRFKKKISGKISPKMTTTFFKPPKLPTLSNTSDRITAAYDKKKKKVHRLVAAARAATPTARSRAQTPGGGSPASPSPPPADRSSSRRRSAEAPASPLIRRNATAASMKSWVSDSSLAVPPFKPNDELARHHGQQPSNITTMRDPATTKLDPDVAVRGILHGSDDALPFGCGDDDNANKDNRESKRGGGIDKNGELAVHNQSAAPATHNSNRSRSVDGGGADAVEPREASLPPLGSRSVCEEKAQGEGRRGGWQRWAVFAREAAGSALLVLLMAVFARVVLSYREMAAAAAVAGAAGPATATATDSTPLAPPPVP